MNVIEHAILINAAPDTVWEYVSNVKNNEMWQANCNNVAFISTKQSGTETRWRYEDDAGGGYIAEITAWYDKLGYEYTIVDGISFEENKGRIRLQEVPEGTIVQWTFTYKISGLIGGIRNSIGIKRGIQTNITDGLRALYKQIQQLRKENNIPFTAKSLMQEAPDVEARQQYQPRHESAIGADLSDIDGQSERLPVVEIPEPPLSDEDTKPTGTIDRDELEPDTTDHPSYQPPQPIVIPEHLRDPESLIAESKEELLPLTANQRDDEVKESTIASETDTPIPIPIVNSPFALTYDLDDIEEDSDSKPQSTSPFTTDFTDPKPETLPESTSSESEASPLPHISPFTVPINEWGIGEYEDSPDISDTSLIKTTSSKSSVLDTAEISVFELFGLQKPSETQEIPKVVIQKTDNKPVVTAETSVTAVASATNGKEYSTLMLRGGLRYRQRQEGVRIRHRK